MYVLMDGYRVNWTAGEDQLLVMSVGTGQPDPSITPTKIAAKGAMQALLGLMDDSAALVETMMQWMSSSKTPRVIDREIGSLANDLVGRVPLFTYLRYDLELTPAGVLPLSPEMDPHEIAGLGRMDEPKNMATLLNLGRRSAKQSIRDEHLPRCFDMDSAA